MIALTRGALQRGGWHVLLRLAGQALEFLGWVVLARRVGASGFGAVAVAFTLARFAGLVADWGASITGPRDVARAEGGVSLELLRRRGQLTATTGIVTVIAIALVTSPGMIAVTGVTIARGLSRDWIALGRGTMVRAGVPAVLQGLALVCLASAVPASEDWAGVAVGAAYLTAASVSVVVNRIATGNASSPSAGTPWIVGATLAGQLLLELDVLLLAALASRAEAGVYAAVYRVPNALNALIAVVLLTSLPRVSLSVAQDPSRFPALRRSACHGAALAGIVTAVLTTVPVYLAVPVVFGDAFATGQMAAAVLTVGVCVAIMAAPLHPLMLARGEDRAYAGVLAGVASLNLAMNVVLIPAQGLVGAAIATLASQLVLYLALILRTGRLTKVA